MYEILTYGKLKDSLRVTAVIRINDTPLYGEGSLNIPLCAPAYPFSTVPTYDADGYMTFDGRNYYAWDGENRLIGASCPAYGDYGEINLSYAYDAQGRRIRKAVYVMNVNASYETLLYSEKYLYDGWNLTAIIWQGAAATTHTLSQAFIRGPDLSSTMQGAGGVGGLLMIVNASTSKIHFPAYDGNGNIMALLRANTGTAATIDAAYEYDPFGRTLRSTGPYASVNPFRFSTKFTDDETGLVYYGYRYLDVGLGRWQGRDPAAEARGGVNLYGMVRNNALCITDFLGLWGKVERKRQMWAKVKCDTDTWESLAELAFMDKEEKDKWLRNEDLSIVRDDKPVLGKVYSLPNTIILTTGPPSSEYSSIEDKKKEAQEFVEDSGLIANVWQGNGFLVRFDNVFPSEELKEPSTLGWIFNGHGNQLANGKLTGDAIVTFLSTPEGFAMAPSDVEINHGLGMVAVYACQSANASWQTIVNKNGFPFLFATNIQ